MLLEILASSSSSSLLGRNASFFFPFQNGKYANEFEKVELTVYGSWKIVKFRLTLKKSGTR